MLKDANTAFLCSNFLFGGLTLVFLYLLAREVFSDLTGLIVCILFLFNPIFWFYGEVTSSYLVEACFSTLLAYLSYKLLQIRNKDNILYILALSLGISGGFRQDIPFFMLPLCLYAALSYTKSVRKLLLFFSIFCISVAMWYIPTLLLSGGYWLTYLRLYSSTGGLFGLSVPYRNPFITCVTRPCYNPLPMTFHQSSLSLRKMVYL